jgi:hypothetical protein
MTEFRTVVGAQLCPDISREEIVNACGVDDLHDGVNYVRAPRPRPAQPSPPCLGPLLLRLLQGRPQLALPAGSRLGAKSGAWDLNRAAAAAAGVEGAAADDADAARRCARRA